MENIKNGQVILITGGSRSGKSEFAEELLKDEEKALYIATAIITDEEMKSRVHKHRERRKTSWTTYEGYKNLQEVVKMSEEANILLDCVTTMLTNLMFEKNSNFDDISSDEIELLLEEFKGEFLKIIESSRENNKRIILVTNEVGYGIVPVYKLSRIFRDLAGSLNQYIAKLSDEVYLVACGIPLKLK